MEVKKTQNEKVISNIPLSSFPRSDLTLFISYWPGPFTVVPTREVMGSLPAPSTIVKAILAIFIYTRKKEGNSESMKKKIFENMAKEGKPKLSVL